MGCKYISSPKRTVHHFKLDPIFVNVEDKGRCKLLTTAVQGTDNIDLGTGELSFSLHGIIQDP